MPSPWTELHRRAEALGPKAEERSHVHHVGSHCFLGSAKSGWNRNGHAAGSGPFHAAGEQGLESDTAAIRISLACPCVTEHGDIDATAAPASDPIQGLAAMRIA